MTPTTHTARCTDCSWISDFATLHIAEHNLVQHRSACPSPWQSLVRGTITPAPPGGWQPADSAAFAAHCLRATRADYWKDSA
jgi:hypothetical protein